MEGGSIRCPFHHWEFGTDGGCTKIPYARRIPPKATLRSWPVAERNGMVMIYHDPGGGELDFQIPEQPHAHG